MLDATEKEQTCDPEGRVLFSGSLVRFPSSRMEFKLFIASLLAAGLGLSPLAFPWPFPREGEYAGAPGQRLSFLAAFA